VLLEKNECSQGDSRVRALFDAGGLKVKKLSIAFKTGTQVENTLLIT
jgi:hypothetical protein